MISKYLRKKIIKAYFQPDSLLYKLKLNITHNNHKYLTNAALDICKIKKNDNVLEINFGIGYGLTKVFQIVKEGKGKLYGTEVSDYCIQKFYKYLGKIGVDHKTIKLYKSDVSDLPIMSNSISVVYHVNCFYSWNTPIQSARGCLEMFRVLQPGGQVVTTFEKSTFRNVFNRNIPILNPLNYMYLLECSGFEDVHIHYHEFDDRGKRNFQSIVAKKPASLLLE